MKGFPFPGAVAGTKVENYHPRSAAAGSGSTKEADALPPPGNRFGRMAGGPGLVKEPPTPLFSTVRHRKLEERTHLPQANAHIMVQRRAAAASIRTKIPAHSFRATGITTYLQNGGKLEVAQQLAGRESARTTGLYDHRNDSVALEEVERIAYLTAVKAAWSVHSAIYDFGLLRCRAAARRLVLCSSSALDTKITSRKSAQVGYR